MTEEDNGSSLVWFLAGAALGAAGALVLAPQSGVETRDILRRRAEESRQRAYEAGRRAAGQSREAKDSAFERGREVIERGRHLYEEGRQMADEAASSFRHEARPAVEGQPEPTEG